MASTAWRIDPNEVRGRLDAVVAAMKAKGVWDVERPPEAAFTDMGPFGGRTMSFEGWLRWVFVPSVEARLASAGPWPGASSVGARAAREGDTNPAVAGLVEALSAFDALFEPAAASSRGGGAGRTPDEALADRADALVEAGREGEALAQMGAATESPLAATAHNWLAWFFAQRRDDPERAAHHGDKAVALRPDWGVARLNLAWARERLGAWQAAYCGYLDALACGDAHDEAFAEERVAELAAAAAARGEPLPRFGEGGPAARRVAGVERLMLAMLGELAALPDHAELAWFAAVGAPVPPGDEPFGWLGTSAQGRVHVHALVHDLGGGSATVQVQARAPGGELVMRTLAVRGDAREAARAVADWIRGGGASDPKSVTPLDAAVAVRTALFTALPGRRLRLGGGGDPRVPGRPAAATVVPRRHPSQLAVTLEASAAGGVVVRGMPIGLGARPPPPIEAATLAELHGAVPRIVESCSRAMVAFDAFRGRSFPVARAAGAMLGALTAALAAEGSWEATVADDGYPRRWPLAHVKVRRGDVERASCRLDESTEGCRVEVAGVAWVVRSDEELAASLPAIVGRLRHLLRQAPA